MSAKQKRIDIKTGLIFSAFALPGTIIGPIFSTYIPVNIFRIILGILFVSVPSILFINTFKNSYNNVKIYTQGSFKRAIVDSLGTEYIYSFNPLIGIIFSLIIGLVSTLFGIGGGIFYFPLFVNVLSIPVKIAINSSIYSTFILFRWHRNVYLHRHSFRRF